MTEKLDQKDNPYQSPKDGQTASTTSPRILFTSIGAVFCSSVIGGAMGLLIGVALGTLVPSYYRSTFSSGDSPNFDPVAVGIGQGLTQGVVFGGLIGLILVAMFYWSRNHNTPIQNENARTRGETRRTEPAT